jgi:3-phosphoshikimate 1-carboxyvinyltransferase
MRIRPARRVQGCLQFPGDKSISHRAALIAALAAGTSRITNFATGADCAATIRCLKSLGVTITEAERELIVQGVGRQGFKPPNEHLDCGNSASTMRMLAGVLAGQSFTGTMVGDESLSNRPMMRVIEPLELMGATIYSQAGKAPLTVVGSDSLKGLPYNLPIASAQVKSCILLAALNAAGQTSVTESVIGSRDHTERMLKWFAAPITEHTLNETNVITIAGQADLLAHDINIPGDVSSAAYFAGAGAVLSSSDLTIENVGLNPTRTKFFSVLKSLGMNIEFRDVREECNEPRGTIHVLGQRVPDQSQITVSGSTTAQLIDELPLLAILGSQIPAGIEIRDAEELRFKETDRIKTTVNNLRVLGASVEEFDDGLRVSPGALHGAQIKSYGDHRIAMAFTVAALLASGDSEIDDIRCVGVSFPEFFELLDAVVER